MAPPRRRFAGSPPEARWHIVKDNAQAPATRTSIVRDAAVAALRCCWWPCVYSWLTAFAAATKLVYMLRSTSKSSSYLRFLPMLACVG